MKKLKVSWTHNNDFQIPFTDIFCVGYMLSELVAQEEDTQLAGLVSITDASGFGIKHVNRLFVLCPSQIMSVMKHIKRAYFKNA